MFSKFRYDPSKVFFFRDLHRFENDEESIFNGTDLLYSIEHSTVCVAGK